MNKISLLFVLCLFSFALKAQEVDFSKVNSSNTWFKLGINAGVPVSNTANVSNFTLGADLSVQFLRTKAYGIGLKAGFVNYFGKDPAEDFTAIPLAALFRYYPESIGLFGGIELGYAFVNNLVGTSGGGYSRVQLGWHTDNWNYFGYYDHIVTEENVSDIQSVGLGATYNLRFGN